MKRSLRWRLIQAACGWVLALTALGGVALALSFKSTVTRTFDEALAEELRTLVGSVETAADGTWWLRRQPDNPRFGSIYSGHYWQVTEGEGKLLRSRSLWDESLPPDQGPAQAGPPRIVSVDGPNGQALRMIQQRVTLPRLAQTLSLQIASSREGLDAQVARFSGLLALALVTLALGLIVAVWLQVGYGLRPLRRLAVELRAVREGRRDALAKTYPTEIAPLVDELDAVLDHNRRLVERARSSSADLAHALKTPLSVVAAELHAPGNDWRTVVDQETRRMRNLIDRHMARAATVGAQAHGQRTALAPVVDAVIAVMRRIHADRQLDFQAVVPPDLAFAGEREDLEEVLGNLLDNAGKWAGRQVTVSARPDADRLIIEIDDDGPGLADEQREAGVRRGQRFDQLVPGSGLGLAIVDDIVASYAGHMDLATTPAGGLRVRLELPAASQP